MEKINKLKCDFCGGEFIIYANKVFSNSINCPYCNEFYKVKRVGNKVIKC